MAGRVPAPMAVQDRVPRRTTNARGQAAVPTYVGNGVTAYLGEDPTSIRQAHFAWVDLALCPEAGQLVSMEANILTNCFFDVAIDGVIPKQKPDPRTSDGAIYAQAVAGVRRRFGDEESQGVAIADLARILSVTGDSTLLGYHVDASGNPVPRGQEHWEFLATDVVRHAPDSEQFIIWRSPSQAVPLVGPIASDRIFQRHTRHPNVATSWMVQAHPICIDLALFRMARRATGRSQVLADLLLVPSEASPDDPTMSTAWGSQQSGTAGEYAELVEEMIHGAIKDAMKDAADGRQVLPLVMAVESEYIDAFTNLAISRTMDPEFRPTVESLRKELAEVADMPPESLFGLGNTNRWNGRQVTEEEFRRYLGPKAKRMGVDLTKAVVWKDLLALKVKPEVYQRFSLVVNPNNAVVRPDWATVAPVLAKDGAIGPSGERRLLGLDDSYAPTAEEKANKQASSTGTPSGGDIVPVNEQQPANKGTGKGRQRDDTVNPDNTNGKGQVNRVAGSATVDPLSATTERLAILERETRARLEEACEAAWDASLARAGSQFKNWSSSDLKRTLNLETRMIPFQLGPDGCQRLSLPKFAVADERDAAIFGPALAVLLAAWGRIIDNAWERSDLAVDESEIARWRDQSIAVLRDSMIAALGARVFIGPIRPSGGELAFGRIPKPILRRALAVAGGAPGVGAGYTPEQQAAVGMLFGPLALSALGAEVLGWEWLYGERASREKPFEWHWELNGLHFQHFTDPRLEGGPFGMRYPGDHYECQCDLKPVLRSLLLL